MSPISSVPESLASVRNRPCGAWGRIREGKSKVSGGTTRTMSCDTGDKTFRPPVYTITLVVPKRHLSTVGHELG